MQYCSAYGITGGDPAGPIKVGRAYLRRPKTQ
jgi:hypothetical protein